MIASWFIICCCLLHPLSHPREGWGGGRAFHQFSKYKVIVKKVCVFCIRQCFHIQAFQVRSQLPCTCWDSVITKMRWDSIVITDSRCCDSILMVLGSHHECWDSIMNAGIASWKQCSHRDSAGMAYDGIIKTMADAGTAS